jgi:hypothetical protein
MTTKIRLSGGSVTEYKNDINALDKLDNIFSKLTTKKGNILSSSTIKSYIAKLNRLSILCTNHAFIDDSFLNSPQNVIIKLNHTNLKSKKDYISAIIKYLSTKKVSKQITDEYLKAMNLYKKEQINTRNDNKASENNVEKSMPLDEIKNKLLNFNIVSNKDLLDALLVCFYFGNTDNLVLRNDLPNMRIISITRSKKQIPKDFNYLVVDKDNNAIKIIMKSYKTSATFGTKSFGLSNNLKVLLKDYLKRYNKTTGDFLFTRDGKPYSHQNFAYLLETANKNVIGKPIGIDLARQIITTDFYLKHPLASKNEKDAFADKFLHSASTNAEYMRNNLNV